MTRIKGNFVDDQRGSEIDFSKTTLSDLKSYNLSSRSNSVINLLFETDYSNV